MKASRSSSLFIKKSAEKKGCSKEFIEKIFSYSEKLEQNGLPIIFSLKHLSLVNNCEYGYLRSIIKRKIDPYISRSFRKRSGGRRRISVPNSVVKTLQKWILKNILSKVSEDSASMAYRSDKSIYTNALVHCEARWLIKIDLVDFFHSINEISVFRVFKELGFAPILSFELTRLTTRELIKIYPKSSKRSRTKTYKFYTSESLGVLPQGAPTSPKLANLVFKETDILIREKCKEYGFEYTRYADDISISTSRLDADSKICSLLKNEIIQIIKDKSYKVNIQKTRILKPGQRKIVTGLVVNDEVPRLPKEIKNSIEFNLQQALKRGPLAHVIHKGFYTVSGFKNHLQGMIRYCYSIDSEYGEKLFNKFDEIDWSNPINEQRDITPNWRKVVSFVK